MKSHILIAVSMIIGGANQGLSQKIETGSIEQNSTYEYHIKKRNQNRTGGWVAVGGGVGLIVFGVANNFDKTFCMFECEGVDPNEGIWPAYVGAASVVGSIPLFVAARKHGKAAKLEMSGDPVVFKSYGQSALGFSLKLNLN
ncbi:hypothetical protein [Salinimicrobium oceani]|uniref:Uncharacterized protein n=1 Tax=Salinimicrobium oceani TaxID=2722702 RepID=A0ABX1D363_9FLAO|nr:hypothetical protein [Salinimicrobium oceani]NJW53638.1 hypothetical protein [Salinimicrobium oceani]